MKRTCVRPRDWPQWQIYQLTAFGQNAVPSGDPLEGLWKSVKLKQLESWYCHSLCLISINKAEIHTHVQQGKQYRRLTGTAHVRYVRKMKRWVIFSPLIFLIACVVFYYETRHVFLKSHPLMSLAVHQSQARLIYKEERRIESWDHGFFSDLRIAPVCIMKHLNMHRHFIMNPTCPSPIFNPNQDVAIFVSNLLYSFVLIC